MHVCPALHAVPQRPQFVGSLCRSAHAPLHVVWPAGQVTVPAHMPAEHVWPMAHVRPQVPQFAVSI